MNKFTPEQIEAATKRYQKNLCRSYPEKDEDKFIITGKKIVKIKNACHALHRKNTRVRIGMFDYVLNLTHEDYMRFWILINEERDIKKYFFLEDVIGYISNTGEVRHGIVEVYENYVVNHLEFELLRVWDSLTEKSRYLSLSSSML